MRPRLRWPRTLLWRSFALIALLLTLSISAWFLLFSLYGQAERARYSAQLVASVVNLTRSALLASDIDRRIALLRDLSRQEGIHIYPAEPDDGAVLIEEDRFTRAVSAELRQRLGASTRLAAELQGQPGIYVSFRVDPEISDDEYWVMLPQERFRRAAAVSWLGWGVAAILLALIGAYLIVFGVTRPLKRLERAARAIGRGEVGVRVREDGAQELSTLAQAFNQMSNDLAQLESDRALILAGISHDLKTPLARLRLGIEMSGATTEDIEAMAGDIEEMDRIIRQFLDFARDLDSEAATPTRLEELLANAAAPFNRKVERVRLHATAGATLTIRPLALRRALSNLIENALRYGPPEGPVELSLETDAQGTDLLVADRGPGIPADEVERLKRPFTRLEAARTNAGGSGLGLAIVDRIARLHGGELRLEARPGGGLNARLHLPL